jgi:site-specific DNA-methyltransferase (adenine-specific)
MKITDKINLHHIDCMDFMRDIPDNYYSLSICDPPYGIGEDGGKNHSRGKKAKAKEYTPKNWDSSAPSAEYFIELIRVSQNVIIWGANHFIENIPNANTSSWIVWDKENGDNDFADCELAWTNHKNAVRKFEFRWAGMLQGDMKNKENRIHPTQKPVALYKWILDKYAKPNDKILDTHGGSMSIAIACHDYGFDLDLCELDKEYFDKGVQRVKNHVAQQKLF